MRWRLNTSENNVLITSGREKACNVRVAKVGFVTFETRREKKRIYSSVLEEIRMLHLRSETFSIVASRSHSRS